MAPVLKGDEPRPHPAAGRTKGRRAGLVFFCGVAIWNYLTTPFLLAHPEMVVEELPPWQEDADRGDVFARNTRRASSPWTTNTPFPHFGRVESF